jgi:hypothetical protein
MLSCTERQEAACSSPRLRFADREKFRNASTIRGNYLRWRSLRAARIEGRCRRIFEAELDRLSER